MGTEAVKNHTRGLISAHSLLTGKYGLNPVLVGTSITIFNDEIKHKLARTADAQGGTAETLLKRGLEFKVILIDRRNHIKSRKWNSVS